MSLAIAPGASNPAIFWYSEGVSADSQRIRTMIEGISSERRRPVSFAWRDELFDHLQGITENCSDRGWDGYDSEPISREIALLTKRLIEVLPEGMQSPRVIPESDGDISLVWRTDDQKHFVLTMTGPTLVYAGIFGGLTKSYGEERFSGALPPTILDILTKYFPEN